jgi:hypothetical protein
MRATRQYRHHLKSLAVFTGLAMLTNALVAPATRASAGTNIVQVNPLQGVVLNGTAFTDQLQVTGGTGAVTFAQATGSANVAVSSSGQVSAASTLSPGTYSASGTDSDGSGDTGTWSYTLNVLQPAPPGFANTMVNIYQSEVSVAQQLSQDPALEPVSQYQQALSQLTPAQLAAVYFATQQSPEFVQIPSLVQTVASAIPPSGSAPAPAAMAGAPAQLRPVGPTAASKSSPSAHSGVALPSKQTPSKQTPSKQTPSKQTPSKQTPSKVISPKTAAPASTANAAASAIQQVQPYDPSNKDLLSNPWADCSTYTQRVPLAAIFAVQIILDAANGAYNILSAINAAGAETDYFDGVLAASIAVAAVALAAQIIVDTLTYVYNVDFNAAAACVSNDQLGYLNNIDNTTTQAYGLLTTAASTLTLLQTMDTNIQLQLTSVQNSLQTAITNDTTTMQTTVGSDTQAVTTQLQTNLTALKQDVDSINTDQTTLNQTVVNQVNTDSSQVSSALSSALSKILNEIDTAAGGLTTLVTQDNQQIMNTLQANFNTQQGQHKSDLKVSIEEALAKWGNSVPPVQYILPVSQGGFLNSTPVGVQEVVTDDLAALAADGVKASPAALTDLKNANAALAAGQYVAAYGDYASCYEAFA